MANAARNRARLLPVKKTIAIWRFLLLIGHVNWTGLNHAHVERGIRNQWRESEMENARKRLYTQETTRALICSCWRRETGTGCSHLPCRSVVEAREIVPPAANMHLYRQTMEEALRMEAGD
jgi:hypothetical protein